jgi:hypothetical protein
MRKLLITGIALCCMGIAAPVFAGPFAALPYSAHSTQTKGKKKTKSTMKHAKKSTKSAKSSKKKG